EDRDHQDDQDLVEGQPEGHPPRITAVPGHRPYPGGGGDVSDKDLSWKYAEEFPVEPPAMQLARQHSLELGIDPISPAAGAQLAVLAAAINATSILEIGTGAGVSGLWLLQGAPAATLTTIDVEIDHQNRA